MNEDLFKNEIFLIYGRPKIGKSSLAAQFPKPLFISTEPGLKYVKKDYKLEDTQVQECNDWRKIIKLIAEIEKQITAGTFKYKTIVVDTIDKFVDYCTYHVCSENSKMHPSEIGSMGKGYALVTDELKRQLYRLSMTGVCLIMISHDKMLEITTATEKYNKMTVCLGGKNRDAVINLPDHVLYIDNIIDRKTKEERRVIKVRGSRDFEAGSRNSKLCEVEDGIIPLDFNELIKYFN